MLSKKTGVHPQKTNIETVQTVKNQIREGGTTASYGVFYVTIVYYAIVNAFFGHNIALRGKLNGVMRAYFAIIAFSFVLFIQDYYLRSSQNKDRYEKAKWALAITPLIGWLIGAIIVVDRIVLLFLAAYLGGSTIVTSIRRRVQTEYYSFWTFLLSATLYSTLLVFL